MKRVHRLFLGVRCFSEVGFLDRCKQDDLIDLELHLLRYKVFYYVTSAILRVRGISRGCGACGFGNSVSCVPR